MRFKLDKEALLFQIRGSANSAIHNELWNRLNPGTEIQRDTIIFAIQEATSAAIEEAFRTMLDNRYTDDDFEKDIGLKP